MEIDALPRWLTVAGVPAGTVRVGPDTDGADRAWCLRPAAGEGDAPGWEVFWCEDGGRYAWTWFDEEATACFALFGRLVWARLARGAGGC